VLKAQEKEIATDKLLCLADEATFPIEFHQGEAFSEREGLFKFGNCRLFPFEALVQPGRHIDGRAVGRKV